MNMNVFYTDKFVKDTFAGCAIGPFVFIRPIYKNDKGLLAHEQTHVKQFFFTLFTHGLLYKFIPKYRLWSEVQAYKVQASYYEKDKTGLFASYIATRYNLDVTQEEVEKMLSK